MKRGLTIIFLLLILILPIASAVEFDMKTNFSKGETLMAKLSGNFLEQPVKESIKFYRGHTKVPIEADVAKINDEFYIYALLPEPVVETNYSIVIENVGYYKGSQISEDDIVKNFSITNNLADFSVEPGFIITNDDFYLEVQNLQDYKLEIKIKTETIEGSSSSENQSKGFFAFLFGDESVVEDDNGSSSVTLKSGEIEKIKFKLDDIENPVLKTIELSTNNLKYEIPVYIFLNKSTTKAKDRDFVFDPSELNFSMSTNSNLTKIIYLFNDGDDDLENISLIISDSFKQYLSVSPKKIDELKKDQQTKIELKFETGSEEKTIEGSVKAKESEEGLEDVYAYTAISLNIIKGYIPSDDDENGDGVIDTGTKTCSELGGTTCNESQECDGEIKDAKDDKCCIGSCNTKTTSSTGKIIGWLIIIGVMAFIGWFFLRKFKK